MIKSTAFKGTTLKRHIITALIFATSILGANAFAQVSKVPDNPRVVNAKSFEELKELLRNVKGIKSLPGSGFNMVETKRGQTFAVSNNGRFVIQNPQFLDMWNGKALSSVDDMTDLDRIDFKRMRINLDELSSFSFGKAGAPEMVIFIDPFCPYCEKIIKQAIELKDQYRFRAVVIPILGEKSKVVAKNMVCAQKDVVVSAIMKNDYSSLPPAPENCSDESIQRALVVATVMGITGVPFSVMPSGRLVKGFSKDVKQALIDDQLKQEASK